MKFNAKTLRSSVFKGYASTYIVEFLVLLSNLLVYKLCTVFFGSEGLAEISVFKRIFAFIQPILLFGILIGITRFVALTKTNNEGFEYFFTSFIFFIVISTILIILLNVFSQFWSNLLFDTLEFEKYILPLSVSISGIYFHLMIYGYKRGKHNFLEANYLQLLNIGIVPVFAFLLSDTLKGVLLYTGYMWCLFSIVYFIYLSLKYKVENHLFFDFFKLKKLLKYGVPRVPGDVAYGGLFALPIIIVSHYHNTEIAGRLAFSLTILSIVGAAFSPLSLMLLPTISQKLKNNMFVEARKEINISIVATVLLSGFGVLIYEVFAYEILYLYLGEDIISWVEETKLIMLGGVFFALFITLRSVIDAYHIKAVNSFNLVVTVVFFSITAIFIGIKGLEYVWFYKVFLLSLLLLVVLTLISIYKIQKKLKIKSLRLEK